MKEFKPFHHILILIGMSASVVIFVFTTFETKVEAERQYTNETNNIEEMDHKISDLHQDLRDTRKEINSKLDILVQGHR